MTNNPYAGADERMLLASARFALHRTVQEDLPLKQIQTQLRQQFPHLSAQVEAPAACFVTFFMRGDGLLRGCMGTLAPRQALIDEVAESTVNTAQHDPRFHPVTASEAIHIQIELSILTESTPLPYSDPDDLLNKLTPYQDGVTLCYGNYRATFLPQVWENLPDPVMFLNHLCQKMGVTPDFWETTPLEVETYQAIKLVES